MGYFDQRYPGQTSLSGSCCSACAQGATTCGDAAVSVKVPTTYLIGGALVLVFLLMRNR